jgi:hypothetical protein
MPPMRPRPWMLLNQLLLTGIRQWTLLKHLLLPCLLVRQWTLLQLLLYWIWILQRLSMRPMWRLAPVSTKGLRLPSLSKNERGRSERGRSAGCRTKLRGKSQRPRPRPRRRALGGHPDVRKRAVKCSMKGNGKRRLQRILPLQRRENVRGTSPPLIIVTKLNKRGARGPRVHD